MVVPPLRDWQRRGRRKSQVMRLEIPRLGGRPRGAIIRAREVILAGMKIRPEPTDIIKIGGRQGALLAVPHFLCSRSTMINETSISPHVKRECENPGRAWTVEDENIAANQSIIDNNRSIALLVERMSLQLTEQRLFYSQTLSEMDDLRHEIELLKKRNVELEANEHSTQQLLLAKPKEVVRGKDCSSPSN